MPDITSYEQFGLGPVTGNWFSRLANYAEQEANIATARHDAGPRARGNAAALQVFAGALRNFRFSPEDPLNMIGEAVFRLTQRHDPAEPYVPSPTARKVLHNVGQTGHMPWESILQAWVTAELRDFAVELSARGSALTKAEQNTREAEDKLTELTARHQQTTVALAAAEGRVAETSARLREAEAQINYLSATLEGEDVEASDGEHTGEGTFPSAEQLEAVFDKRRVTVAPGVFIGRHQVPGGETDTHYGVRVGPNQDRNQWLASATDGHMSIEDAVAARERLLADDREPQEVS